MTRTLHAWRWLVLSAALGLFGLTAACGKMQPRPAEQGPRVVGISGSGVGLRSAGTVGTNLNISMVYGAHTLNFAINVSQSPSFSPAQRIGNADHTSTDYTLQAVCIDIYCDRIGFLLQMTTYGYVTNNTGVVNGYGGTRDHIMGRSAKAYLFRSNVHGTLEQVNAVVGPFQTLSEGMAALGAYY